MGERVPLLKCSVRRRSLVLPPQRAVGVIWADHHWAGPTEGETHEWQGGQRGSCCANINGMSEGPGTRERLVNLRSVKSDIHWEGSLADLRDTLWGESGKKEQDSHQFRSLNGFYLTLEIFFLWKVITWTLPVSQKDPLFCTQNTLYYLPAFSTSHILSPIHV